MALGCGAKILKYCLFAFNLIFFIAGVLCIGIGVWLLVDDNAITQLMKAADKIDLKDDAKEDLDGLKDHPNTIRALGIILVVGGVIVFVIAFLGCCGAVKEWRPLLVLYGIFLMIILAIELAAVIYAAINRNGVEEKLQTGMKKSLKYYNYTQTASIQDPWTKAWDTLQEDQKCCGVDAKADDFKYSRWYNKTDPRPTTPPPSCCPLSEKNGGYPAGFTCNSNNKLYDKGCYEALKDWVQGKLAIVIGVAAAVAAIQLIGIIFAFCLCSSIGQDTYA